MFQTDSDLNLNLSFKITTSSDRNCYRFLIHHRKAENSSYLPKAGRAATRKHIM